MTTLTRASSSPIILPFDPGQFPASAIPSLSLSEAVIHIDQIAAGTLPTQPALRPAGPGAPLTRNPSPAIAGHSPQENGSASPAQRPTLEDDQCDLQLEAQRLKMIESIAKADAAEAEAEAAIDPSVTSSTSSVAQSSAATADSVTPPPPADQSVTAATAYAQSYEKLRSARSAQSGWGNWMRSLVSSGEQPLTELRDKVNTDPLSQTK